MSERCPQCECEPKAKDKDCVFPKCEFASSVPPRQLTTGDWVRYCRLSAQFNDHHGEGEVYAETCASCPVPLFMEAVKAVTDVQSCCSCYPLGEGYAEGCGDCKWQTECPVCAALATLPKKEAKV